MHTQKRYATCPKGMKKKESAKKREKMHTQRRYATCSKGMSKKEKNKDAYPEKVCHMPTRHVKKKEKRKEKDRPHPWKK